MTINPIPDRWEECKPKEATQVWLSVAGDKLPAVRNLDHDMSVRINGNWVDEQAWPALGIIPIRQKKVEPIEFVVQLDSSGKCYVDFETLGVSPRMRFRQVIEE